MIVDDDIIVLNDIVTQVGWGHGIPGIKGDGVIQAITELGSGLIMSRGKGIR